MSEYIFLADPCFCAFVVCGGVFVGKVGLLWIVCLCDVDFDMILVG